MDYLEKQHEADPLIISVLLPLGLRMRLGIVHPEKRHLETLSFSVSGSDGVRTVYPTVRVQHILRQIFAVNAIDRVANVLSRSDDQRKRDEKDHG